MLDTIDVMHYPLFGELFLVGLFPNEAVFKNISSLWPFIASTQHNIAIPRRSSTLPTSIIFPQMKLSPTPLAILRCIMFRLAAIRARVRISLFPFSFRVYILAAFRAINPMLAFRFRLKTIVANLAKLVYHIFIIHYKPNFVK